MKRSFALLFAAFLLVPSLAQAKTELWVYTSIYKEFIAPIAKAFEKKNPAISVQVFQGGSEKLEAKLESELMAQRPQADVILISDPFWGVNLEKRGLILTRRNHPASETNYYSLMVMIAHSSIPVSERPLKWADLNDPKFTHAVQMGNPLESGTTFTAVAYLSELLGWDYFDQLRKNNIGCAGGNSAVLQKVESRERKIGVVLLENALAARKRGSPIEIIYPSDGGIPVPSVQFILKSTPHPEEAQKFSDFVLSEEGQRLLREGYMYPVNPEVPAPDGAQSFEKATGGIRPWTAERISRIAEQIKFIKNKFSDIVLE